MQLRPKFTILPVHSSLYLVIRNMQEEPE